MPKDRETDVPRDATVLVTASRPVDHHSATGVRVRTEERDVEGVLDISSDGRILFWRPTQTLQAQARHEVTISGIRDERGTLFDDHASTFVTGVFSYDDLQILAE
ncbi:MAG: Ig-like domain-containing protein [Vicinamibacteria bacterium]